MSSGANPRQNVRLLWCTRDCGCENRVLRGPRLFWAHSSASESDVSETFPDIAELPFEKAMQELEEIVGRLEKGQATLDESVKLYERGEALKKRCETLLREAEARIEKITLGEDGAPRGLTPLDVG